MLGPAQTTLVFGVRNESPADAATIIDIFHDLEVSAAHRAQRRLHSCHYFGAGRGRVTGGLTRSTGNERSARVLSGIGATHDGNEGDCVG